MSENPHAPLFENLALLERLLWEAVSGHEGKDAADVLGQALQLSASGRKGEQSAKERLRELLRGLNDDDRLVVARGFAQYLNLANIAERQHRIRRRRFYLRDPEQGLQRGSLEEGFKRLLNNGVSPSELFEFVCRINISLVLTAHPTEINRRTVLHKHTRIANLLERLDCVHCVPWEHQTLIEELRREISTIWYTDEIIRERPTPLEEANAGLLIFESTLWNAIPKFARALDETLIKLTDRQLPLDIFPIKFGSWMGGDRDGHPRVTADVTRQVIGLSRWLAADLYYREIVALRRELSLCIANESLKLAFPNQREPYRALLAEVRDKLHRTRACAEAASHGEPYRDDDIYLRAEQLREPLMRIWTSLHDVGAGNVARGRLLDILRRLSCFGLTLVRLDIRQESARHTSLLDEITQGLQLGSYKEWSEEEPQQFLTRELMSRRPLVPRDVQLTEASRESLDTFQMIAEQETEALGAYVISMASKPSDVLAVELLQKEAGVKIPLRVVPLFETLADLQGAGAAVERLLDIPWFREQVAQEDNRLEIMVGYSDSAKDAHTLEIK